MDSEEGKYKDACLKLVTQGQIKLIKSSQLMRGGSLGTGGQSDVIKGMLDEKTAVSIKALKQVNWKRLFNELVIISNLVHENIPKFFGMCIETANVELIFQLINAKTLTEVQKDLSDSDKINITKQLTSALVSVNNKKFIHRDLKPENILIDTADKNKPYIIDFGIGKVNYTEDEGVKTKAMGTMIYLAPEILDEPEESDELKESKKNNENKEGFISEISHKVDVWAFGCVISYMFSGWEPWRNKYGSADQKILRVLREMSDEFPIPKEITNKFIVALIKACCTLDSDKRPTIDQIQKFVDQLS